MINAKEATLISDTYLDRFGTSSNLMAKIANEIQAEASLGRKSIRISIYGIDDKIVVETLQKVSDLGYDYNYDLRLHIVTIRWD